jgi:hypothetical protein
MTELQENMIAHHRTNLARTLSPFLELLENQKQDTTQTQWLRAVRTLMARIIESPDQYLTKDLPPKEVTTAIVRSIFHEFIMKHTPFPSIKTSTHSSNRF